MANPRHRAQSMTEYIIILGLVAIGLITAVKLFGGQLQGLFGAASQKLSGGVNAAPPPAAPPPEADRDVDEEVPPPRTSPPEGDLTRENPFVWDPAAHNGTGGFKHRDGGYVSAAAVRAAGFDPSRLVPLNHPRRTELLR